ncbi:MAG TPA: signal peptidase I [Ardenticatenaceae bacterium]|nr:signal peptidase I [Ardenticatenaceae bacterium]
MKNPASPLSAASAAAVLVLLAAVWISFAPLQFGGQAAYVIVTGNSMEPNFHLGDLAVLRRTGEYEVGDVATFHHPQIGPVIHRIIGKDGDRFIFKGDNNSWIDSYRPRQDELIGELWIYLPSAGRIVEKLRSPHSFAAMAAVIGLSAVNGLAGGEERTRRRRGRKKEADRPGPMNSIRANKMDALFALAAVAFASLLLAFFAFTRPLTRSVADDISYQHSGTFTYVAEAPPGVYDSQRAETGEPVFRRLSNRVTVAFGYQLVSEQPAEVAGTAALAAEIGDGSGWTRSVELQGETAFEGSGTTLSGDLDLPQLQALIDGFERQTGLQRQQYQVAVVPIVRVDGSVGGQSFGETFAPRLEFQLDRLQLQLARTEDGAGDPLAPSQAGLLKQFRSEANTLSLLSLSLPVSTARWVAVAALLLSTVAALALALQVRRQGQGDEVSRIQHAYGAMLINVRDSGLQAGERVVEVASIEDLAKLAEKDGRMILHEPRGPAHHYYVQDAAVTYHYEVSNHSVDASTGEENVP